MPPPTQFPNPADCCDKPWGFLYDDSNERWVVYSNTDLAVAIFEEIAGPICHLLGRLKIDTIRRLDGGPVLPCVGPILAMTHREGETVRDAVPTVILDIGVYDAGRAQRYKDLVEGQDWMKQFKEKHPNVRVMAKAWDCC